MQHVIFEDILGKIVDLSGGIAEICEKIIRVFGLKGKRTVVLVP